MHAIITILRGILYYNYYKLHALCRVIYRNRGYFNKIKIFDENNTQQCI